VDSGSTPVVKEQAADLNDVTKELVNSRTADDVMNEASRATKRRTTQHSQDVDTQATKRRLETMLQLETHARRAIEENFQRVKGFSFVFTCAFISNAG